MDKYNIFAVAFSAVTYIITIYQCVYTTRYPKKSSTMGIIRSILTTAALTLTPGGGIAAFIINPWFALASAFGLLCCAVDQWLAKYDLDPNENDLLEKFLAFDIKSQVLLLQAVELKQRVVVCESSTPPVTINGTISTEVDPIDVQEMAAQGLLGKCRQNVETRGTGLDSAIVRTEYYTPLDDARKIARLLNRFKPINKKLVNKR